MSGQYPFSIPPGSQEAAPWGAGAVVLGAADLSAGDLVVIINGGAIIAVTTLGALAQFIGQGLAFTSAIAGGFSWESAPLLPGSLVVYTNVAPGTGAAIPASAEIGAAWEVWNGGDNVFSLWPPPGVQIQTFGEGYPAAIAPGGRAKFVRNSITQIYAG